MIGKLGAKQNRIGFLIGFGLPFIGVGTYGVYAWIPNFHAPKSLAVGTYNRGLDKLKKSNYPGAIADFTQAISIDPKNVELYLDRGLALRRTGDHKGAIQDFSKMIELSPENYYAYNNRCAEQRVLALENYPLSVDSRLLKQALLDCEKSISLKNEYASPYYNLGVVQAIQGDMASAKKSLEKSAELLFKQNDMEQYELIKQELERLAKGIDSYLLFYHQKKLEMPRPKSMPMPMPSPEPVLMPEPVPIPEMPLPAPPQPIPLEE